MKINLDNPILGYKLDPGEPGIASSSPASLSIIRVLSQETGNLIAFKKQAAVEGGYVIYSKISLDMQKRGAFLAAVAGKTEVKIAYNEKNKEIISDNQSNNSENKIKDLENLIKKLKSFMTNEDDPIIKKELKNKINILESQLLLLKLGNNINNQNELILGMIFTAYF
ncbi:hypothetical protein [Marinitoga sp. 38H-ov]|uniref:hypothetical protein n=1 Tax=Marinitoga sp. 38H-ov TaxID=1755814 RepID=UPI0013ED362D|nr:hypothetical protein [Marinitoga sp. 38H-ov]KAF2957057.1 hypothetical protein AS160_03485 [Marinitoga sp. 38H-ov]